MARTGRIGVDPERVLILSRWGGRGLRVGVGFVGLGTRFPAVSRAGRGCRPRLGLGGVEEVVGQEQAQVVSAGLVGALEPPRVATDRVLELVAREAAVAERRAANGRLQRHPHPLLGLGGQLVVGAGRDRPQNLDQLVVGVVVELDRGGEAAGQARVLGDERDHGVGVAGHDDDEVLAVVLHLLDEGVDRLLGELVAGEGVRLVDEQHAVDGLGDHLGGLHGCLSHVAGHELAAVDLDELALGQQLESPVDGADEPRDGGLAGAGVTHEDQVPAHLRSLEACFGAQPLHREQGDLPVNLLLHPVEADHRVELGQQLLDRLLRLGRRFRRRLRRGLLRGGGWRGGRGAGRICSRWRRTRGLGACARRHPG